MIHIVQHLDQAAVLCAIIVIFYISIKGLLDGKLPALEVILSKGFAASAIPTGFALLWCAINPDDLQLMSGFNIHIAIAGCVLIFLSIKGIF